MGFISGVFFLNIGFEGFLSLHKEGEKYCAFWVSVSWSPMCRKCHVLLAHGH